MTDRRDGRARASTGSRPPALLVAGLVGGAEAILLLVLAGASTADLGRGQVGDYLSFAGSAVSGLCLLTGAVLLLAGKPLARYLLAVGAVILMVGVVLLGLQSLDPATWLGDVVIFLLVGGVQALVLVPAWRASART